MEKWQSVRVAIAVTVVMTALSIYSLHAWLPGADSTDTHVALEAIAKPAENSIMPEAGWMKLYQEQRDLIERVSALDKPLVQRLTKEREAVRIPELAKRAQEIGERLNRAVPPGYRFNENSLAFEPLAPKAP